MIENPKPRAFDFDSAINNQQSSMPF